MNKDDFEHGDKVTCYIKDVQIKDAKISINENGDVYICQNKKDGSNADDKLEYKYSWNIYRNRNSNSFEKQLLHESVQVTNLQKVVELQKIQDEISVSQIDKESASLIKQGAARI